MEDQTQTNGDKKTRKAKDAKDAAARKAEAQAKTAEHHAEILALIKKLGDTYFPVAEAHAGALTAELNARGDIAKQRVGVMASLADSQQVLMKEISKAKTAKEITLIGAKLELLARVSGVGRRK